MKNCPTNSLQNEVKKILKELYYFNHAQLEANYFWGEKCKNQKDLRTPHYCMYTTDTIKIQALDLELLKMQVKQNKDMNMMCCLIAKKSYHENNCIKLLYIHYNKITTFTLKLKCQGQCKKTIEIKE